MALSLAHEQKESLLIMAVVHTITSKNQFIEKPVKGKIYVYERVPY
jgi:hypothetical protein